MTIPSDNDFLSSRAPPAYERPTDLNSSSSASSSLTAPTLLPSGRRSRSSRHASSKSSRHGSSTITDESDNSHFLECLISREEEIRAVNATLVVTNERLEAESTRANDAERRALDYSRRLRTANENCERAEQESARLREELMLYKLQLENAQKEIFRAQDILGQVASQRDEAEAEAARSRSMARRLREEKLVMLAREDGYEKGLSSGRKIGHDKDDIEPDEDSTNEERSDIRPSARLHAPPREQHSPSSPRERDEPENILPIAIPIRPLSSPHKPDRRHNDREKGTRKEAGKGVMTETGNGDRDSERVGSSVRTRDSEDRDQGRDVEREAARSRDRRQGQ